MSRLTAVPCTPAARAAFLATHLWVVEWNARSAEDPDTMRVPPNMPVRVLIEGALRLPEHAFLQCRDLKTARVASGAPAFRQIIAWLEEVADDERR